jgi:hypothetical protein
MVFVNSYLYNITSYPFFSRLQYLHSSQETLFTMPIDWKSSENNERLLACLFASLDEAKSRVSLFYHHFTSSLSLFEFVFLLTQTKDRLQAHR